MTTSKSVAEQPPESELITEKTIVYHIGSALSGAVVRLFGRVRFLGRENIPEGGALLVANHQSGLDIPSIAIALKRHVAFVARASLAESRLLDFVMRRSGAVLIKRGQPDRKALREMVAHLRAGDLLVVYPEGTRSRDGRVGPFRGGALLAGRQARVPIVPVAIDGTRNIKPPGAFWPRFTRVTVAFGTPIDPATPTALEDAREAILAMLGQEPEALQAPPECGN